jgi:hypothetical protein
LHQYAGESDKLSLPHREAAAPLTYLAVEAVGQRF